jgi:hypothetical protein
MLTNLRCASRFCTKPWFFVMVKPLNPPELAEVEEIYIDETSQNGIGHRFLIMGGIILPINLSRQFEQDIIQARWPRLAWRLNKKMQPTEIGWNDVSKGDFPAYKKVVDAYFSFAKRHNVDRLEFFGSIVDTHVRGRRYSGQSGELGFDREIYFHCMSIARRHRHRIFHVYLDERSTACSTPANTQNILRAGMRIDAYNRGRDRTFRRVQYRRSNDVQALQISDLFIGAIAYRLNRHYDQPGGADKKLLCEYILRLGKFWDYIKPASFREKGTVPFVVWFRKHKN